jgi:hypothetical protein
MRGSKTSCPIIDCRVTEMIIVDIKKKSVELLQEISCAMRLRAPHSKFKKIYKKSSLICAVGESNPGPSRGRRRLYHLTNRARLIPSKVAHRKVRPFIQKLNTSRENHDSLFYSYPILFLSFLINSCFDLNHFYCSYFLHINFLAFNLYSLVVHKLGSKNYFYPIF